MASLTVMPKGSTREEMQTRKAEQKMEHHLLRLRVSYQT